MKKLFALCAFVALSAACATSKPAMKSETAEASSGASAQPAEAAPAAPGTEVQEASLRTGNFEPRADLKTIHFDFDSAKLSDQALATLKDNAEIIRDTPSIEVLVAGYCDQRGTIAYNLALGQRRAKEVRDYYMRLGVDGRRVATISYGKERLLCAESAETCWSQNRRAETLARAASKIIAAR